MSADRSAFPGAGSSVQVRGRGGPSRVTCTASIPQVKGHGRWLEPHAQGTNPGEPGTGSRAEISPLEEHGAAVLPWRVVLCCGLLGRPHLRTLQGAECCSEGPTQLHPGWGKGEPWTDALAAQKPGLQPVRWPRMAAMGLAVPPLAGLPSLAHLLPASGFRLSRAVAGPTSPDPEQSRPWVQRMHPSSPDLHGAWAGLSVLGVLAPRPQPQVCLDPDQPVARST